MRILMISCVEFFGADCGVVIQLALKEDRTPLVLESPRIEKLACQDPLRITGRFLK